MKTKILVFIAFFVAFLFCIGCDKEDNNSIDRSGNWVNEKNDTIFFYKDELETYDNGLLIFKKFDPHHTILYVYRIEPDSIFLFPSHSSNLNDWKGYPIQWGENEFILLQYNDTEKSIYKRLN